LRAAARAPLSANTNTPMRSKTKSGVSSMLLANIVKRFVIPKISYLSKPAQAQPFVDHASVALLPLKRPIKQNVWYRFAT
jgi:hypothetical protein